MTAIRVLIVDDHPTFRRTIRAGLEDYPTDLQVVGEAADGQRAIDLVEQMQPDVVLMDIRMRGMDGVTATRILRERYPACRIARLGGDIGQAGLDARLEILIVGALERPFQQGSGHPDLAGVDRVHTPPVQMVGGEHPS